MKDTTLRLLDCGNENANETNEKTLELYVTFHDIKFKNFKLEEAVTFASDVSKTKAVIFRVSHYNNTSYNVDVDGDKTFTIRKIFKMNLGEDNRIRVFYWNSDKPLTRENISDDIKIYLDTNGITKTSCGNLSKPQLLDDESTLTPEEAGNGGVVGVIIC